MVSPLQEWLKTRGMSQAELAVIASSDAPTVSRIARGQHKPFGKVRRVLAQHCPEVLEAQDRYVDVYRKHLTSRLKAA